MMSVKAVIFDFIGTLTELVEYSLEDAENRMFRSLVANGYNADRDSFFEAYNEAYQKYRKIRYEQLVEVTNAVWVSEALNSLGYHTTPQDEGIEAAVNVFFEDYLNALRLRSFAKLALQKLSQNFKLGLVSNFTYAPVIYAGLRKLGVNGFFDAVLVSEAIGWRKPSPKIFREALRRLRVRAAEAVYVGDTPLDDIQGAKNVGMKTIFIPSQFNSLSDMQKAPQQPDFVVKSLPEVFQVLSCNTST
jgi:putative hydrolase of the HAD superfamily